MLAITMDANTAVTSKVLIVSPVRVYADGLQALLRANGIAAEAAIVGPPPIHSPITASALDAILVDCRMANSAKLTNAMHRLPAAPLLVFGVSNRQDALACVRLKPVAIFASDATVEEIKEKIIGLQTDVMHHLPFRPRDGSQGMVIAVPGFKLTRREQQVALLMKRGLSNKAIAGHLQIAPSTAKVHVRSVLYKLGVPDRMAAVLMMNKAPLDNDGPARSPGD